MYKLDVLEVKDFQIEKTQTKGFYDLRGEKSLSKWMRTKNFKLDSTSIATTNGLTVSQKEKDFKVPKNYMGYLHDHSNNVQYNTSGVGLYTTMFSDAHGTFFDDTNYEKIIAGHTARSLIQSNWVDEKDEYLAPNEEHQSYSRYVTDAVVYSLFNNSSFQSSLRQVEYKDKFWDIKNEFFWMSKDRMKELADENGYDNLYNDARTSSDRHVYNLLFGEERIYDKLSDDAKVVLDKATELVEQSLQMRQVMADDHNHLDSWDSGYAQLKLVWKEYFSDDFKEFRDMYKGLEDRMRPLVYELGFLKK